MSDLWLDSSHKVCTCFAIKYVCTRMIYYHWVLMRVRKPNNPGITMRTNTN